MSQISDFYRKLTNLVGIETDHMGRFTFNMGELAIELKIDETPVVFPDKVYMELPENSEGVALFHPLSESTVRNTSEMQELLRRAAILQFNILGRAILQRAIEINADITSDSGYKPTHKISELFANVSDVDDKFLKWWEKINTAMDTDSKYRLFDIYIKRNGELNSSRYDRITSIASPMFDETLLGGGSVFGVTQPSKRALTTLYEILKALFPDLVKGGYQCGSNNTVAPTLDSYMQAVVSLQKRINEVVTIFGKAKGDLGEVYNSNIDVLENVDWPKLRNAIPADKEFNVGTPLDDANSSSKPSISPALKKLIEQPITRDDRRQAPQQIQQREAPQTESGEKPWWDRDDKRNNGDRRNTWGDPNQERIYRDHAGRRIENQQNNWGSRRRNSRDSGRPNTNTYFWQNR